MTELHKWPLLFILRPSIKLLSSPSHQSYQSPTVGRQIRVMQTARILPSSNQLLAAWSEKKNLARTHLSTHTGQCICSVNAFSFWWIWDLKGQNYLGRFLDCFFFFFQMLVIILVFCCCWLNESCFDCDKTYLFWNL